MAERLWLAAGGRWDQVRSVARQGRVRLRSHRHPAPSPQPLSRRTAARNSTRSSPTFRPPFRSRSIAGVSGSPRPRCDIAPKDSTPAASTRCSPGDRRRSGGSAHAVRGRYRGAAPAAGRDRRGGAVAARRGRAARSRSGAGSGGPRRRRPRGRRSAAGAFATLHAGAVRRRPFDADSCRGDPRGGFGAGTALQPADDRRQGRRGKDAPAARVRARTQERRCRARRGVRRQGLRRRAGRRACRRVDHAVAAAPAPRRRLPAR